MSFSETIAPLLGRCALAWFYGAGAYNIVTNWTGLSQELIGKHVPLAPLVLVIALILMAMGAYSLLFGYHTRHGAVLLFAMTIIAAVSLHDFWHIADPAARRVEFEIFSRDMAICGGLLVIIGMGCGPWGWDNRPPPGSRGKKR
jgi:putative oxidoreductase